MVYLGTNNLFDMIVVFGFSAAILFTCALFFMDIKKEVKRKRFLKNQSQKHFKNI